MSGTRRPTAPNGRRRGRGRWAPLPLLLLALVAFSGCGGEDEVAGGAADLPGPVPAGVEFAEPPASAVPAPAFRAELVDGRPVRAGELWADRPVVLVFTASYCGRCREIHRAAAEAVDAHDGAVALLGLVGADDAAAGAEYADELDLGHPLAVVAERVWLSFAAREPGLVVLVAQKGRVVRGWPTGASTAELEGPLDDLVLP